MIGRRDFLHNCFQIPAASYFARFWVNRGRRKTNERITIEHIKNTLIKMETFKKVNIGLYWTPACCIFSDDYL